MIWAFLQEGAHQRRAPRGWRKNLSLRGWGTGLKTGQYKISTREREVVRKPLVVLSLPQELL